MRKLLMFALITTSLILIGCSANIIPQLALHQEKVTLASEGYEYQKADIILIDTQIKPQLGDIVYYDWKLNKSACMAFGPEFYLAKIIAYPGDKASFNASNYTANGFTGTIKDPTKTKPAIWGNTKYEDCANMQLLVPDNEYLADKWIGFECTEEKTINGSSKPYNRFTIKQEAIKGVLLKKLGHDKEFEEQLKLRQY